MEPRVRELRLDCSLKRFLSAWERSHAVLLRQPRHTRSSSSAATPRFYGELHDTLRKNAKRLESGFTAAEGCTASKRQRAGPSPPSSMAALLRGSALPLGSYYCSMVVSRQPELIRSLLAATAPHDLAPPCFAAESRRSGARRLCVRQESALWLFIGRNGDASQPLHGRPPHTDAVTHDGTYHRQLEGSKEWHLRPTEELVLKLARGSARRAGGGVRVDSGIDSGCTVRCDAGDVLVISTRDWWHSTNLPAADDDASDAASVSISAAREFNLVRGGGSETEAAADGADADVDEGTSFVNVDGLFASRSIAAGTAILSEEECADLALPSSGRAAEINCEVAEDEEGTQWLVATRDIRSGEFLCLAE